MNCGVNQIHARTVRREYDMAVFDSLPPELREWMRNLAYDMTSPAVRVYFRRCGLKSALKKLPEDFKIFMGEQVLMVWGADHPALWRPAVKRGRGRPRKNGVS